MCLKISFFPPFFLHWPDETLEKAGCQDTSIISAWDLGSFLLLISPSHNLHTIDPSIKKNSAKKLQMFAIDVHDSSISQLQ